MTAILKSVPIRGVFSEFDSFYIQCCGVPHFIDIGCETCGLMFSGDLLRARASATKLSNI